MPSTFRAERYTTFESLPLDSLDHLSYSIYIIDFKWNYLFVNTTAKKRLQGIQMVGKSNEDVIKENPSHGFEKIYNTLKDYVSNRKPFNIKTISPLSETSIEVTGHPLNDCYYFSVKEFFSKQNLLDDLRRQLKR